MRPALASSKNCSRMATVSALAATPALLHERLRRHAYDRGRARARANCTKSTYVEDSHRDEAVEAPRPGSHRLLATAPRPLTTFVMRPALASSKNCSRMATVSALAATPALLHERLRRHAYDRGRARA